MPAGDPARERDDLSESCQLFGLCRLPDNALHHRDRYHSSWSSTAVTRVIDNLLGSVAALLAVLVLWPDFGPTASSTDCQRPEANLIYLERVTAEGRSWSPFGATCGRLASIDVEVALHDLGGLRYRRHRLNEADLSALTEMRNLAARQLQAWHRRLAEHCGR